jgi:purine-binding chemotaxis protein CheW
MQPVLVCTEAGRPVGLAIDKIVDIVEERLDIELRTEAPGILGAAILRGKTAEIVDLSHYLGEALGARLDPKSGTGNHAIRLLLVDDSLFFRNMLAPLLKASGYEVTLAASAEEALALRERGAMFDLIVSDRYAGDGRHRACRAHQGRSALGTHPADRALLAHQPAPDREEPRGRLCELCRQVRPADADEHASGLLQTLGSGGMSAEDNGEQATEGLVTVVTGGQLFGLKVLRVRDVFVPRGLSQVPLAPPEVAGLLNLRGRIVTAIDVRRRLGLSPRTDGGTPVAVGIEERGELYGLIVDRVGDVVWLKPSSYDTNPANLDQRWAKVCAGVHRLDQGLLVVLDVDKVLNLTQFGVAA